MRSGGAQAGSGGGEAYQHEVERRRGHGGSPGGAAPSGGSGLRRPDLDRAGSGALGPAVEEGGSGKEELGVLGRRRKEERWPSGLGFVVANGSGRKKEGEVR